MLVLKIGDKMNNCATAFTENYYFQEKWIRGQIEHAKHDSFVDLYIAEKEIDDAGIVAFACPSDTDSFRDKHLSDVGKRKLSSSLRTFKKRQNRRLVTKRLDIDISRPASLALEILVKDSGLTKIQVIEQLLLEAKAKKDVE